jgi:hypothetical protein
MFAIQVRIGNDDWIYITESIGKGFELRALTFETFEQADQAASVWRVKGKENSIKVVEYNESKS